MCHSPFSSSSSHISSLLETGSNLHIQPPTPSPPNQLRWSPFTHPQPPTPSSSHPPPLDFVSSLRTVARTGDPALRSGIAVHVYTASASMGARKAMQNSDGDFLVVVQQGGLVVETEMGLLSVDAGEIFVVPRGYYFFLIVF